MTPKEKEILLKDLCGRLPYEIKGKTTAGEITPLIRRGKTDYDIITSISIIIEKHGWKPYLFPLSSMTEKQLEEFYCNFVENEIDFNDFKKYYLETSSYYKLLTPVSECPYVIEWFIENHFDYRGLIPMGLAIDATNLNIY